MTESVWLREGHRSRREGPPLSRERIVAEAVVLLDEEGVGRLTMRRLAERLDTGSTTLYWHVKTKDDVLELALDTIFGDVPLPETGARCRAGVIALMSGWRRAMLDHPWSAAVLGGRPLLGPNVLARTDFLYATLATTGLAGTRLATAAYAVANYVIGSALMQVGAQSDTASAAAEHLARNRDLYPALAEHGHLDDGDCDAAFVQGLDYLLDGIGCVTSP
ncbi:TetR/AcrR family transcriptional regulator C-terminal domain-containing protein [Actinomadura sp. BRA 177]|uniref:TetR/AcrR family transcriptional regulator C-terminal domain-containing protein n=1 Tax=Actinomadura sp. BRA 177 TaxID=2745202 RepID=UPI0015952F4D|nr:TetR/AcrR family transcriptional regulator C-terminal domain-containing protein [Actinomadura sp. BRA 177]NVI93167.1 TetR/AcrR family transcriptional regulator C-terminal domain-containing protein [Actinomadura sp. BRA 177]